MTVCTIARLLIAFTLGSLVAVGYFVAPVAFSLFDKVAAGTLMGVLLHWVELFALVSVLVVAWLCRAAGWPWLLATGVAFLVQLVWLNPKMAALKAGGLTGDQAQIFMQLHGVSQVLYLLAILLLLGWLVQQIRAHK